MSFSSEVKQELLQHMSKARHCRVAELAAILSLAADLGELPERIVLRAESRYLVDKADRILNLVFAIRGSVCVRRGVHGSHFRQYVLIVENEPDVRRILKETGFVSEKVSYNGWTVEQGAWHFDKVTEKSCCRQAFIRGAFLAGGSINDPEKNYHVEILAEEEALLLDLSEYLRGYEIDSRIIERTRPGGRTQYVFYLKNGEQILDFLSVMKAHNSLMQLENIRIVKDVRNTVNRQVNCETANLNKTVSTAARQVADIRYLIEQGAMGRLSPELQEIASIRLENGNAPLKDLGNLCDPPVSKSGVNHRLHRISELAEEVRRERNGFST